jgi:hypothetical protein
MPRLQSQGSSFGVQAVRRNIADPGNFPFNSELIDARTRRCGALFLADDVQFNVKFNVKIVLSAIAWLFPDKARRRSRLALPGHWRRAPGVP